MADETDFLTNEAGQSEPQKQEADINNLGLNSGEVGQIDWDSPEQRLGYPPFLKAGEDYLFTFQLEEGDPFTEREQDGRTIFGFQFKATTSLVGSDGQEHESTIRFQRVDFFQSPKMAERHVNSSAAELLRSMDLRISPLTKENIKTALREADGRVQFRATIGWQWYCKQDKLRITTHTRGKKDEVRWPKGKDGKWTDEAVCPGCGANSFGRAEIIRFRLKKEGQ